MIFFDIDETLLDHQFAEERSTKSFLREHQELFGVYSEDMLATWHTVTEKHLQRYFDGDLTFQGQRRARLREMIGDRATVADDEADNLHVAFLKYYEANWRLFDDVLPCLDALVPMKLGIISNGDSEQQRQKLVGLEIARYFSIIVISGDIDISKPDAGIFQAACREAGEIPGDCMYVGDRIDTDARGAVNAGLRGIWLNRKNDNSTGDDEMIRSLSELVVLSP